MQAKPEIQGIHDHVELSLESQIMSPISTKAADIEEDESDLLEAEEPQTETIEGSQVACAFNRMAKAEEDVKSSKNQSQVVVIMISAVLLVVVAYAGLVLL